MPIFYSQASLLPDDMPPWLKGVIQNSDKVDHSITIFGSFTVYTHWYDSIIMLTEENESAIIPE